MEFSNRRDGAKLAPSRLEAEMTESKRGIAPDATVRFILGGGLLVMLALSMPGHMTYDSLAQLREGRLGVQETWAPVVYAAVLGFFDHLAPGPGLYVTASAAMLYGALAGMIRLRPVTSWWAAAAAGVLVLCPALLIYQGIVWKDVFFANLAVAAFVLLAGSARDWDHEAPRPWLKLVAVVLLLALAAQVRQNGLVISVLAAAAMGWMVRRQGRRAIAGWSLGGLVAVALTSSLIGWLAQPPNAEAGSGEKTGLRIVQTYDIIGLAHQNPRIELKAIEAYSASAAEMVRSRGGRLYSPERIDYLKADAEFSHILDTIPNDVISRQWFALIGQYPLAYLKVRATDFYWVLMTPRIDSCLPFSVGVDGPAALAEGLKIPLGRDSVDQSLANYASWLVDGPAFSHLAYVLLAAVSASLLLMRRDAQDMPIIALALAGFAFAGTFLIISIACDYRYLYFLDLSALTTAFYVSLDIPHFGRHPGGAG